MSKNLINSTGEGIRLVLEAVAIVSSILVSGMMLFLVVARYFLGLSVVGLHELIMLFAVALYMAGALIASRNREHLAVDWLAQRLRPGRSRALHELFVAVVTLVVSSFFILWTYYMFAWGLVRPQTTPSYGIPLWIPQLSILVAAVGSAAYALRDVIVALQRARQ